MSDETGRPETAGRYEESDPIEPILWNRSSDIWRLSSRLSPKRIDLFLRLRSARQIPLSFRARFVAMRIPPDVVDHTLGEVRGLGDWMTAWNRSAQHFLAEGRREDGAGRWYEAAVARRNAAMCYHAAHFVTDTDPRTVRALKAAGVAAFAQSVPRLMPETRRITIPWRTNQLPAYLAKPRDFAGPHPLVVMFNGATTTKEELLLWADPFLERGVAVMTVDWPGTGEAGNLTLTADCDDITDGLLDFAHDEPGLDSDAVILLGFSLGGSVAIRAAAFDRRIAASIAITPPYEPRAWIGYVNPIVRHQLLLLAKDPEAIEELLHEFSLGDVIGKLRAPLLVFGAGRDLVVPPEESLHLASAAGDLATLVWYKRGSHGLYEFLDDWADLAATWITSMFPAGERVERMSTRVDDEEEPAATVAEHAPVTSRDATYDDYDDDEDYL
ncbi:MAG: alpha/beta fold hydrolase [Thermomicrobiales bacterium]|nr:alpha/beta fold hydrolase [Thermomicrobiales bacterium]